MRRLAFMLSVAPMALLAMPVAAQTTTAAADTAAVTEVVVTGLRQSLRSAQTIKRNSDAILDAVVAEDIGKLPDNTAAETLARVAGIQVERYSDEANRVLIRGLPDVATTYNGREIFTAELRRVQLQDFPAQALAGIEVYKSGTADIVEPGLAGLINVRTRRPLDFKGRFIGGGVRLTYNDQSKKRDPNGNILISDRWETSIGEIGVLANATYAESKYRNGVRYNNQDISTVSSLSIVSPDSVGHSFRYPHSVGLYNDGGKRFRPSGNVAIQWKPNDKLEVYFDGIYQGYRGRQATDNLDVNLRDWDSTVQKDPTLTNVTLVPGTTDQAASFTKTGGVAPQAYRSTGADQTDTYQGAVGAIWRGDRLTLSTDLAYEDSEYEARNWSLDSAFTTAPTVTVKFNEKDGAAFDITGFDAANPANYYWRGYYERHYIAKGSGVQWRGDAVYDTGSSLIPEIKFGLRYTDRDASLIQGSRYAWVLPLKIALSSLPVGPLQMIEDPFRGDSQGFTQYLMPTREGIAANVSALQQRSVAALQQSVALNPNDQGYKDTLKAFSSPEVPLDQGGAFSATEQSYAEYAQAKYAFDLGSIAFDGVVGVRVVQTLGEYSGTSRVSANGVTSLIPRTVKQNYTDVLPNVSLRIHPADKVQLRLGYTQTRTRVDFGNLNPALNVSQVVRDPTQPVDPNAPAQPNAYGSGGNPDLVPLTSNNYDVSAEYYFSSTGSITVAGFYRDLFGFTSNYTRRVQDPVYGLIEISRPENSGAGKIKGFEINAQTFLDFLPDAFKGFGVQGNVTYIDGKNQFPKTLGGDAPYVRITGLSKWTYNAAMFYERNGVTGRISYNRRSPWVNYYRQAADGSQYAGVGVRAISRLDASLSYDLSKQLTISFDVTNLLAKPFENYNNYSPNRAYPVDVRYEGRYYGVGMRFRFGQ
ncbi:TonB-dependent receptor [Caulobacter sp. 1776]|uniref:TonB-dependent receptor n=1 Tax=Caulobacter sp. 1776 TaxID=3156420 RepID=UPI0033998629